MRKLLLAVAVLVAVVAADAGSASAAPEGRTCGRSNWTCAQVLYFGDTGRVVPRTSRKLRPYSTRLDYLDRFCTASRRQLTEWTAGTVSVLERRGISVTHRRVLVEVKELLAISDAQRPFKYCLAAFSGWADSVTDSGG
jgi:hypothetical protein